MNQAVELTIEQEFSLRNFSDIVQQMTLEQAQEFLIEQQRLTMLRDTLYKDLLKQVWNLE